MYDKYRRVFVLGNGFDLAHYLPTQYIHFMEAMAIVEKYCIYNRSLCFDTLFRSRLYNYDPFFQHTSELYETENLLLHDKDVLFLKDKIKNNFWYLHFKNHLNSVVTWIDFESEIENTLIDFDLILNHNFKKETIIDGLGGDYTHAGTHEFIDAKFWEFFGIKYQIYKEMFNNLAITIPRNNYYDDYEYDYVEKKYLKIHGDTYFSFNEDEVFKKLSNELDDFKIIFQKYISLVINKLEPKVPFKPFGDLGKEIEAVFTFNYSNTFERFYPNSLPIGLDIQYIHGSAEKENIVLGISDLSDDLKQYKIFNFVKSYQSIIQDTDYKRIIEFGDYLDIEEPEQVELLIWGHSLDISDKKYILEMLDSNCELNLISHVWYFQRPHSYLANLMSILGESSVLKKIKNRKVRLDTPAPDILELNKKKPR